MYEKRKAYLLKLLQDFQDHVAKETGTWGKEELHEDVEEIQNTINLLTSKY